MSISTIINPSKDLAILKAVKASVETDLDAGAIGILARTVLASRNNLNSSVLSTDLLVNPPVSATYDKQYVLIPKAGNGKWGDIQKWVNQILN